MIIDVVTGVNIAIITSVIWVIIGAVIVVIITAEIQSIISATLIIAIITAVIVVIRPGVRKAVGLVFGSHIFCVDISCLWRLKLLLAFHRSNY